MREPPPLRTAQSGFSILEGLIAVLIFSLGILAIIGLQATSIKLSTDAKYRTDASFLANELIGQMWINYDRNAPTPTLKTNIKPGGTDYATWLAEVQATLPGAQANPPVITFTAGNDNSTIVKIQMFWKAPSESIVHNHTINVQVR